MLHVICHGRCKSMLEMLLRVLIYVLMIDGWPSVPGVKSRACHNCLYFLSLMYMYMYIISLMYMFLNER